MLDTLRTIGSCARIRIIVATTFSDKLSPVPILNMLIQIIDRSVTTGPFRVLSLSKVATALSGTQRRVATVGMWILIFAAIAAADGVGHDHRGQWVPF